MENEGTERTTISMRKGLFDTAKNYAEIKKQKFSSVVEDALERLLKSEGHMQEDEFTVIEKAIMEARSNGVTVTIDYVLEKISELGAERICNG